MKWLAAAAVVMASACATARGPEAALRAATERNTVQVHGRYMADGVEQDGAWMIRKLATKATG